MRRALLASLSLSLLLATCTAAPTPGERTLTGTYIWNPSEMGSIEAVFKPAGEGRWEVSFHFVFNGSPHTYVGTAEGSLDNGELSGQVTSDGRKRTFVFRGNCKEGKFSGTHAETTRGREESTGTLTLEAKAG